MDHLKLSACLPGEPISSGSLALFEDVRRREDAYEQRLDVDELVALARRTFVSPS